MKVGYIGDIQIPYGAYGDVQKRKEDTLVRMAVDRGLKYLILTGGISKDFHITIQFVKNLESKLSYHGVKLRFVAGNTDFYNRDFEVNKADNFQKMRSVFETMQSYLPINPIAMHGLRIYGAESWYDYTFYRGKPRSLRDITRKKYWFQTNQDVRFISDEDDYMAGVSNCFDVKYADQCIKSLTERLDRDENRYVRPFNLVVVQYFYPHRVFLGNGWHEDFWGTYKGSDRFIDVMSRYKVTECVFGLTSDRNYAEVKGVKIYASGNNYTEGDYYVQG